MTLTTTTSRVSYPGAGAGPFAFPFKIFAETDLLVTKRSAIGGETVLSWPVDFSVTGTKNDAGGSVTLTTALLSGETLILRRNPPLVQPFSFQNQGPSFPRDFENELDRILMQIQANADTIARSLKLKESLPGSPGLVELEPTAGFVLTGTGTGYAPAALVNPAGVTLPPGRTVTTLSGYILNNARFNVKDYGAVGNGTIDDHVAIQLAVNAAQANGGGRVYFPHATLGYNIGTTTIAITAANIVLEAEDPNTYLKYSGSGYAVTFALAGSAQMHNCGTYLLGIVGTAIGSSGLYIKSPYGFFMDHGYFENVTSSNTAVGVTIDGGISIGGITHTGTGYFAPHNVISHIRCNGFLKGILFMGGALAGWDITTASAVVECFVGSQVGLTGSTGIEFQGSQQCRVRGGNYESLDYGIKLVSTPSICIGIVLDAVRFEGIAVNNWLIPAGTTGTCIIHPSYSSDNGSDLAADTIIFQGLGRSKVNTTALNKVQIACVNGNNNHTLARGNSSYIKIAGPTGAFAIGGFSLDAGGFAVTDGTELTVVNQTAFAMTINNQDGSATANCGIRTPTGANVVQAAGSGGSSAQFVYDASLPLWILVGWTP